VQQNVPRLDNIEAAGVQDRTTATALTVVASAIRGELAAWPDAWCMLTDGSPPPAQSAAADAAGAASTFPKAESAGAPDEKDAEVMEVKHEDRDGGEVVVVDDDPPADDAVTAVDAEVRLQN
jgi:hypothetical protein